MLRRGALMAACFTFGPGLAAYAASPVIYAAETTVRLGLTAGYGQYEETISQPDNAAGALLGGVLGAGMLTPSGLNGAGLPDLYTNLTYDFSAGFLHDQGGQPYHADDTAFYNTVIVRLGLGWTVRNGDELIPYIAGGYQNWNRNVSGANGFGEYYQAGLIGGGLRFDIAASPLFVVTASAEGLAVIGGSVSAPSQNFSGRSGTSAQERVGLDADYRMGAVWHAFAGVGLTHYNYTGSRPGEAGVFAPFSSTLQINSMLGVAYGF